MSATVTCPNCSTTDVISIELTPNDVPMLFRTCRGCEHSWWVRESDRTEVAVGDILSA